MNQSGFVNLSLIAMTPFIFSLLFGTFWLIWFLNQKHHIDNICHQALLESQQHLVTGNKQLLALNTLAWTYIFEKKLLEAVILIGPPPAKVVAHERRIILIQQQRILAESQKKILQLSSYTSQASLFSLRRKFYGKVSEIKDWWKSSKPNVATIKIFPQEPQVKIRIKDIASVYERRLNHPQAQSLSAQWYIPLGSLIPQWLNDIIKIHSSWSGECNSHPHKGDYQWHPAIGKAKHS